MKKILVFMLVFSISVVSMAKERTLADISNKTVYSQTINLTDVELGLVDGGLEYSCFLSGALVGAGLAFGNPWAVAGGLIGAYNSGCFN